MQVSTGRKYAGPIVETNVEEDVVVSLVHFEIQSREWGRGLPRVVSCSGDDCVTVGDAHERSADTLETHFGLTSPRLPTALLTTCPPPSTMFKSILPSSKRMSNSNFDMVTQLSEDNSGKENKPAQSAPASKGAGKNSRQASLAIPREDVFGEVQGTERAFDKLLVGLNLETGLSIFAF